jgi:hypothetical protein
VVENSRYPTLNLPGLAYERADDDDEDEEVDVDLDVVGCVEAERAAVAVAETAAMALTRVTPTVRRVRQSIASQLSDEGCARFGHSSTMTRCLVDHISPSGTVSSANRPGC